MKKAICKHDLNMFNGERCFTKGRSYKVVESESNGTWLIDDSKTEHRVDGWAEHFDLVDVPERTGFLLWLWHCIIFVPAMIGFCVLLAKYPEEPECE